MSARACADEDVEEVDHDFGDDERLDGRGEAIGDRPIQAGPGRGAAWVGPASAGILAARAAAASFRGARRDRRRTPDRRGRLDRRGRCRRRRRTAGGPRAHDPPAPSPRDHGVRVGDGVGDRTGRARRSRRPRTSSWWTMKFQRPDAAACGPAPRPHRRRRCPRCRPRCCSRSRGSRRRRGAAAARSQARRSTNMPRRPRSYRGRCSRRG